MSTFKEHFTCRYWPIKKTIKDTLNGQKWISRCRHDYYIVFIVDYSDHHGNVKNPKMLKTWFTPDGSVWAQTGNKDIEPSDNIRAIAMPEQEKEQSICSDIPMDPGV